MDRFVQMAEDLCPKSDDGAIIRVVQDLQSKLDWAPTLPDRMTHEQAQAACAAIGFRLPTLYELESLRDHTRFNPATHEAFARETKSDFYWSSTPDASAPAAYAWGVHFYCGPSGIYSVNGRGWVRPVRASQ